MRALEGFLRSVLELVQVQNGVEDVSQVGGKETAVIELGPDGTLLRRGSRAALEAVEQLVVLVDPRQCTGIEKAKLSTVRQARCVYRVLLVVSWGVIQVIPQSAREKAIVVLLLPSTTSRPTALVNLEVGLQYAQVRYYCQYTELLDG